MGPWRWHMHGISSPFYWLSTILKHYLRIIQLNLRDRDNLRTKDKRPVPKVSFVRRFDCNFWNYQYRVLEEDCPFKSLVWDSLGLVPITGILFLHLEVLLVIMYHTSVAEVVVTVCVFVICCRYWADFEQCELYQQQCCNHHGYWNWGCCSALYNYLRTLLFFWTTTRNSLVLSWWKSGWKY